MNPPMSKQVYIMYMDLPNQIPGTSVGGFGEALRQEEEKRYIFLV